MPDDVNFASPAGGPEPSCTPAPLPGCTHPYGAPGTATAPSSRAVDANRAAAAGADHRPAQLSGARGHDQFYGYGRVNINRSVRALLAEPDPGATFESRDPARGRDRARRRGTSSSTPAQATFDVTGEVWARGLRLHLPGAGRARPLPRTTTWRRTGDFAPVDAGGGACDGIDRTRRCSTASSPRSTSPRSRRSSRRRPNFTGPEPVPTPANGNGRPNSETPRLRRQGRRHPPRRGGHADDDRRGPARRLPAPRPGHARRLPARDRARRGDRQVRNPDRRRRVLARVRRPRRRQPQRAHLRRLRRLRARDAPGRHRAARLAGARRRARLRRRPHRDARAYRRAARSRPNLGGAMLSSVAVGDAEPRRRPRGLRRRPRGQALRLERRGRADLHRGDEHRLLRQAAGAVRERPLRAAARSRSSAAPSTASSPRRCSPTSTQRRRRLEIVAAAMDRHVYAWNAEDSNPTRPAARARSTASRCWSSIRPRSPRSTPTTHAITFTPDAGSDQQGAIIDTPAVGDLDDDDTTGENETPEIVVGTNEEYDEPLNAANVTTATLPADRRRAGLIEPRQLAALRARRRPATPTATRCSTATTLRPGWPFAARHRHSPACCRSSARGSPATRSSARSTCPLGRRRRPQHRRRRQQRPRLHPQRGRAAPATATDRRRRQRARSPTSRRARPGRPPGAAGRRPPGLRRPRRRRRALASSTPAAGLIRARSTWPCPSTSRPARTSSPVWNTGHRPVPARLPGDRQRPPVPHRPLGRRHRRRCRARRSSRAPRARTWSRLNAAGLPVDPTRWPKVTTDWTVANAADRHASARSTPTPARARSWSRRPARATSTPTRPSAPACSPSSWPRFHHDNANSGDYSRDAVLPGRPFDATVAGSTLRFTAPGDDLLCGTADRLRDRDLGRSRSTSRTSTPPTPLAGRAGARQPAGDARSPTRSRPRAQRYVASAPSTSRATSAGRPSSTSALGLRRAPATTADRTAAAAASSRRRRRWLRPVGPAAPARTRSPAPRPTTSSTAPTAPTASAATAATTGSTARGGDDCVSGQGGADRLSGGSGADQLKGGRGKDRLARRRGRRHDPRPPRRPRPDQLRPGDDIVVRRAQARPRRADCESRSR